MRYPFTQVLTAPDNPQGISATYQNHLSDPDRASFPGTDYLTPYRSHIVAPCSGNFRQWVDKNGTIYACFFQSVDIRLGDIVLPAGTRWDFLHCLNVFAPNSHEHVVVAEGDILAEAGNTGYVIPKPTPSEPWLGTHTHLSIRIGGQFLNPEPVLERLKNYQPVVAVEVPVVPAVDVELTQRVKQLEEALQREKEAYADLDTKKREVEALRDTLQGDIVGLQQKVQELSAPNMPPTGLADITGIEVTDLLAQIAEESGKVDGLLNRWGALIDARVPERYRILRSILKFDIFVIIGIAVGTVLTVGVAPFLKATFGLDISEGTAVTIGVGLGIVSKLLLTRYDTNKDGKIDLDDSEALRMFIVKSPA